MNVKFIVEFDGNGNAVIKFPEGEKINAAKVAKITEMLANKMGKITERHVGHEHAAETSHIHLHEGGEGHTH